MNSSLPLRVGVVKGRYRITRKELFMEDEAEQGTRVWPGDALTRSEWLLLLVLAGVQFTHSMDFMVMMPLGPQCRQELHISPQAFAIIVSSYGFSAAISGLL